MSVVALYAVAAMMVLSGLESSVIFTNKRSQAKVSTVYFGLGSV